MDALDGLDRSLAEAIFTFAEVCRVRHYAPEPLLIADLGTLPGRYRNAIGSGWAFRLLSTNKLMAVHTDGTLYWATRTWRLQGQPSWLKDCVGDYFLIAETEVPVEESLRLRRDIMNGLLRVLELKEDGAEIPSMPLPHS